MRGRVISSTVFIFVAAIGLLAIFAIRNGALFDATTGMGLGLLVLATRCHSLREWRPMIWTLVLSYWSIPASYLTVQIPVVLNGDVIPVARPALLLMGAIALASWSAQGPGNPASTRLLKISTIALLALALLLLGGYRFLGGRDHLDPGTFHQASRNLALVLTSGFVCRHSFEAPPRTNWLLGVAIILASITGGAMRTML